MENLNIDLNLLKFDNAFISDIKGREMTKRCVCIPVGENDIYVSVDEATNKPKGAYLHLTAWARKEEKFEQTHYVVQSLSKEYREANPEAAKKKPILGNGKPVQSQSSTSAQNAVIANSTPAAEDDLPF